MFFSVNVVGSRVRGLRHCDTPSIRCTFLFADDNISYLINRRYILKSFNAPARVYRKIICEEVSDKWLYSVHVWLWWTNKNKKQQYRYHSSLLFKQDMWWWKQEMMQCHDGDMKISLDGLFVFMKYIMLFFKEKVLCRKIYLYILDITPCGIAGLV